ncbi:DUF7296 family protein [Kribbella sp. WER1]
MSFYNFRQNNSGGRFLVPAINVTVEADTPYEANRIAQEHGVYFDGCESGMDCDCCGDRWFPTAAYNAKETAPEPYEFDRLFADDDRVPVQLIIRKTGPKEITQ